MLPNNDIVRSVFTDPSEGILSGLQKGSFLIDSSTVDPAVSKEVAALAKNAGAECFVDAPVSGKFIYYENFPVFFGHLHKGVAIVQVESRPSLPRISLAWNRK